MLFFWSSFAYALAPSTLPAQSHVVYGGVGLSTFEYGASGLIRDRQLRPAADLLWGTGLSNQWELWVDVHLNAATVLDDPSRGPCPGSGDYCQTTASFGQSGVTIRRQLLTKPLLLRAGLSARTDAWNRNTRHRWTNIGQGTAALRGDLEAGKRWSSGFEVASYTSYNLVFSKKNEQLNQSVPADEVTVGLAVAQKINKVVVEAGARGGGRLGVSEYDDWLTTYRRTDDRWAALAYREIVPHIKLSFELPASSGLHIYLGRTVWAQNGPKDTTHLSIGWHRYFAPKK